MISEKDRRTRIKNEYKAMLALPYSPILSWKLAPGCTKDNPTAYLITYHNPTLIKLGTVYKIQKETTVRMNLPEDFPDNPPSVIVVEGDIPWHVNWWRDGRMCPGNIWSKGMWLYTFVAQVGKVLAFDKNVGNPGSPANRDAIPYWNEHIKEFPYGRTDFPRPRGY